MAVTFFREHSYVVSDQRNGSRVTLPGERYEIAQRVFSFLDERFREGIEIKKGEIAELLGYSHAWIGLTRWFRPINAEIEFFKAVQKEQKSAFGRLRPLPKTFKERTAKGLVISTCAWTYKPCLIANRKLNVCYSVWQKVADDWTVIGYLSPTGLKQLSVQKK